MPLTLKSHVTLELSCLASATNLEQQIYFKRNVMPLQSHIFNDRICQLSKCSNRTHLQQNASVVFPQSTLAI